MIIASVCACLLTEPLQEQPIKSLLGKPLIAASPSEKLMERFREKESAYRANPNDADTIIWYGRFLAYKGDYRSAIETFSRGIRLFPQDARMYRHRAHRYITIREFDKAIGDMNEAVKLIRGKPNQIEPDGMPNAKNIPVSTLHGNIYYHLGLAHYLKGNLLEALAAYRKCLALKSNDDNTVSATHWLYMILRRLGREDEARELLSNVRREMNIIENFSYHRACLFYKGELSIEQLSSNEGSSDAPADDAVRYAVANWHAYNGDRKIAIALLKKLVAGKTWQSFGHIAAEADLARSAAKRQAK